MMWLPGQQPGQGGFGLGAGDGFGDGDQKDHGIFFCSCVTGSRILIPGLPWLLWIPGKQFHGIGVTFGFLPGWLGPGGGGQ